MLLKTSYKQRSIISRMELRFFDPLNDLGIFEDAPVATCTEIALGSKAANRAAVHTIHARSALDGGLHFFDRRAGHQFMQDHLHELQSIDLDGKLWDLG
ncbi:MAG: hypothetical protein V3U69_00100 [Bacteroidota bacterium]